MTLAHNLIDEAAELLFDADTDRAPVGPLTERFPAMDIADAYAVHQDNLGRRLRAGRTLVGHKIGLISEPMQTLLGVDEPDSGADLLPGQFIMSGSFTSAAFVHPGDTASTTISELGTVSLTFT